MVARQHQRDDGKVRWIEDMFAANSNQEFATDRNRGRQRRQHHQVGTQQQRQRQGRDQRTQRVELWQAGQLRRNQLCRERRENDRDRVVSAYAEIETDDTKSDQRAQDNNLVITGVA